MNRRPGSPEELFDDMLYSSLDWPAKTSRLRQDSVQDVRQRRSSHRPCLSELYHENSKLYPYRCHELAASRLDVEAVRTAFLRRRAGSRQSAMEHDLEHFARVRPLLGAASRSGLQSLFYALELRVTDGVLVGRHEPVRDTIVLFKTTDSHEYADMRRSLRLLGPSETPSTGMLFVVASFVRNEVLYGARGYRRTLIEAGQLLEVICQEAGVLNIPVHPVLEFQDRTVDKFVQVDGLEEGTLIVLEIGETSSARWR